MGKTVAIIGFGNMGEAFSKRLAGFGCRVIAHDKYRKAFENSLVKEVELETVFHDADIVSLHVPLTEETEFMVNTEFLNRFRKPIILINTARGKVLNTSDLVAAMQQGKVAGACLDVLEYEEGSFEDLSEGFRQEAFQFLAKSERVVLSPHVGGWTHESNEKLAQTLVNKIVTKFGTFN